MTRIRICRNHCVWQRIYLFSLEKMARLPVERVFPAHHSLDNWPESIGRIRDVFQGLKESGKLHHGDGTFDYGDWAVWL